MATVKPEDSSWISVFAFGSPARTSAALVTFWNGPPVGRNDYVSGTGGSVTGSSGSNAAGRLSLDRRSTDIGGSGHVS